jgi:hypothetical protein
LRIRPPADPESLLLSAAAGARHLDRHLGADVGPRGAADHRTLDELAAKNVNEFAFMMQPLKIQGGTGSTVSPIAVR